MCSSLSTRASWVGCVRSSWRARSTDARNSSRERPPRWKLRIRSVRLDIKCNPDEWLRDRRRRYVTNHRPRWILVPHSRPIANPVLPGSLAPPRQARPICWRQSTTLPATGAAHPRRASPRPPRNAFSQAGFSGVFDVRWPCAGALAAICQPSATPTRCSTNHQASPFLSRRTEMTTLTIKTCPRPQPSTPRR